MEKESYKDRQENELEVLKSIFNEDVKDCRQPQEKWTPLDIKIFLEPTQTDSLIVTKAYCSVIVHCICPKNYPKSAPKLLIENPRGLSADDVSNLEKCVNKEAYSRRGEESIFELSQFVKDFLHKRNKQPTKTATRVSESLYEAMMKNKKLETDRLAEEDQEEKRKKQEHLESGILEQLNRVSRIRRNTESSVPDDPRPEVCDEHRHSENIYIPLTGRKIQRGACLGHSQKGCINYAAIDVATGQLLYVTEWFLNCKELEARGLICDDLMNDIEKKITDLSKLRHKHLVSYEGVLCVRRKDSLIISLFQEFLLGISLLSISGGLGWCPEGASMVAKGVLEALIFLHNNGISHGNLVDETVFMDNNGIIKLTDFCFIPFLQELINPKQQATADLPALGTLIESLIPTPNLEMRDFINRCKSERTISSNDLLDHPFLYSMISNDHSHSPEHEKVVSVVPPRSVNVQIPPFATSDHSRLKTEFETESFIGKGAYGDVLKVRNILDNRQYAIKRIPLSSRNKQLYKKMTREVELLSRLNHENVVRYFNSWVETHTAPIAGLDDEDESEWSISRGMVKTHSQTHLLVDSSSDSDDSFSPGWNDFMGNAVGDNDSDIEFADSNGVVMQYEDEDSLGKGSGDAPKLRRHVILYIQMEFCEKSTLRTAIDGNLYQDKERLLKLFREIVEGIAHIHQQGMIHRDLKPMNVFLDSKDHVKIGDFGLATTSVLALQHQPLDTNSSQPNYGDSQTGQVGTALYVAPELSGKASKSTYNQKVDLYSLGIIFFEMIRPPLSTGMERIKTIAAIRQPEINLPQEMDPKSDEVKLLKWLLDHNPNMRPTSEELLQSKLVPQAKLEAYESQEMLRSVLANPKSSCYKNLVAQCLAQESDQISSLFENIKNRVVAILQKHGAIEINTPLLTPYSKSTATVSTVRLMCHSGIIVTLPYDLRSPFLRHIVLNGINFLRRYTFGRVYRSQPGCIHPKQIFECAFDIVTPARGHFLVDAELVVVANEIINEFDFLKHKNIVFRINHTSLLRAIFLYYSVPKEKYKSLLAIVADYIEGRVTKLNVKDSVRTILPGKDQMVDLLLVSDCPIGAVNSSHLKILVKGRGEAPALAKGAIRELDTVISLSQAMGVTIPVNLCVGMSSGYDCSRPGSIFWQLVGENKPGKLTVLCEGGRYDNALEDAYKMAMTAGKSVVRSEMYCAGLSLDIDKLMTCLNKNNELRTVVDLFVYVAGVRPPLKEVTHILKSLWSAGIKCCFVEAPPKDDEDAYAKDLGASLIIFLGEDGCLRLKIWQQDHYFEKNVTRAEIIDYVKNLPKNTSMIENSVIQRNSSATNVVSGLPMLEIIFVTIEKPNFNKRKRLENQIEQKLGNIMEKFNKKETFAIFAVELDAKSLKTLIGCIDPNPKDQSQNELDLMLEKFPKNRQKYLQEIYDEVTDRLAEKKNPSIVGIYSIHDSYYRLIL